ncbi:MAG TPA: FAD-dependent monooxygenase, partial [Mariprofundaceae bacterium]|nr:FAD-dependent monooxygenase [Mariprofundaceae bacterium]
IRVSEAGQDGMSNLETDEARAIYPNVEALGYVVQMHHVLQPMHDTLPENVELLAPASVKKLVNDAASVTVTLQTDTGERQLTARLLVGADGTDSRIRSLAGISCCGWDHNRFGLVASVTTAHGHHDTAYECFRSTGPLAFLPLADGRFSIVWSLTPREAADLMRRSDAEFIAALESAAGPLARGRLGRVMGLNKRACYALESSVAKTFVKGRIVLAGNAAHTLHPVAGQGMNLGLRDVAVLADVLARARSMDGDPGQPILLQEYAERRRLDTAAVVGFTESLLHMFEPDLFPAGWLRSRGLEALEQVGPLRRFLLGQAAGLGQLPGLRLHGAGGNQS